MTAPVFTVICFVVICISLLGVLGFLYVLGAQGSDDGLVIDVIRILGGWRSLSVLSILSSLGVLGVLGILGDVVGLVGATLLGFLGFLGEVVVGVVVGGVVVGSGGLLLFVVVGGVVEIGQRRGAQIPAHLRAIPPIAPKSLRWVRGLLPGDEGAAWLAEVTSCIAETTDKRERRRYVRSYRRGVPQLIWTSWTERLSTSSSRELS